MTAYHNNLLADLRLTPTGKAMLLMDLIRWADSDEGRDTRASLSHGALDSPVTAEDVLALLTPEDAATMRINLGMTEI